jgi:hypothetical protein
LFLSSGGITRAEIIFGLIMSMFDGKWTLIGGENVEAFYDAVS